MKYDRPVWQIMHACADAMPEVFRYEVVRGWFGEHYPEASEATIRAHLIGLTEGGRAKHVQFARRSPVFRRVARGEYAVIPADERGEDPDAPPPPPTSRVTVSLTDQPREPQPPESVSTASSPTTARAVKTRRSPKRGGASEAADRGPSFEHRPEVMLLGSVGDRVDAPAPAKEAFTEDSFRLSRFNAELSGAEWFVLSAEHGLLAPDEWTSPDSRTLTELDPAYRAVWATWVVARLQSLTGSLDGRLIHVDAPDVFTGPLFACLQKAGALVSSGAIAATGSPDVPGADDDGHAAARHAPDLTGPASLHLVDLRHAVSAHDLSSLPVSPGLYGWFVDPSGARELDRRLMLPVPAGLIFIGQVGGSSSQPLADPVLNLRDHLERIQLYGPARASTFRMTMATVLRMHLRMTSVDDPRLTDWMLEHLSVSSWPVDDLGRLRELEHRVIAELDPLLNVDHWPEDEYRARINETRSAIV